MQTAPHKRTASPSFLQSLVLLQPGEGRALCWGAAYFFFLLLSFYFLRPVREAMGIAKGVDKLPWLMTATMVTMLLVNPVYAILVSRTVRRRFIPMVSHFFAANLVLFVILYHFLPAHGGSWLGYSFYVWLSVFNLFVVSIFWSLMTDIFSEDQGKRLFGMISMGGTLGAILGAACTESLSRGSWGLQLAPDGLMILACIALELAVLCMLRLAKLFDLTAQAQIEREPSPDYRQGFRAILDSSYLQMICLYILLYAVTSTFLYMTQANIVATTFSEQAARTAAFARMDFWGNVLTLGLQLFVASRLLRGIGVPGVLLMLPLLTMIGFGALLVWPAFITLAIVQVIRRGLHYAVDRPAREILYVRLGPDERYKSKAFIDTFVYRGGDVLGVWMPALLTWLALAMSGVALACSAAWLLVGVKIGHQLKEQDE
ncbi:NTP/NDP exchange transporter [Undibacterium fentianense]|uniref:ADP,ATP carrier protein n=1 Tax=Undibacterium fentianense TaxID=2828728 RepID=A0A941DYM2_9BURK|nr:Npt1/Npt2 family nucleotide transporter [Undibacterium fentianense]MBR7799854.1 MFS transporter [Undibacterium fentianense]